MSENLDTRTVSWEEPLSEGVARLLHAEERWQPEPLESDTTASDVSPDEDSRVSVIAGKPHGVHGWLGWAATKCPRGVVAGLMATHMAVTRLSSHSDGTGTLDPYQLLHPADAPPSHGASISAALVMRREEVRASSLLAPSGAYLTWIEMCAEDTNGEEP
jgi:hypothetical protein